MQWSSEWDLRHTIAHYRFSIDPSMQTYGLPIEQQSINGLPATWDPMHLPTDIVMTYVRLEIYHSPKSRIRHLTNFSTN